jgi:hypothetical protein
MIEGIDEELQQLLDADNELKQIFSRDLNSEKYPISTYKTVACKLAAYFNEEAIFQIFDDYLPSDTWQSWDASQRKNRLHDVIAEAADEYEAKKLEKENEQPTITKEEKSKDKNIPENVQTLINKVKESDLEGLTDCSRWINEHYIELTCITEGYWKKIRVEKTNTWKYPEIFVEIANAFKLDDIESDIIYKEIRHYNKVYTKEMRRLSNVTFQLLNYEKDVIETASKLLKYGDSYQYILDVWQSRHVGDEVIGKTLLTCATSTMILGHNSGIHFKPSGASGKGKTSAIDTFLELLPPSMIVRGGISDKYLYYAEDEINDGSIIFMDDRELNPELKDLVKTSTSNFQEPETHHTIVDKKPRAFKLSARLVWLFASVDGFDDEQLANRFLMADVDETEEQDKEVALMQAKAETRTPLEKYDDEFKTQVCRCIFSILSLRTYRIKIPFSEAIDWKFTKNRRNLPKFMDIITAVCLYNAFQRDYVNETLIATMDDLRRAKDIYSGTVVQANTNLTTEETEILKYLSNKNQESEEFRKNPSQENAYRATINEIADILHKKVNRAKQVIQGIPCRNIEGLDSKIENFYSERESDKPYRTFYYFVGIHDFDKYKKFMNINEETAQKLETEFLQWYQTQKIEKTSEDLIKEHVLNYWLNRDKLDIPAFTTFNQECLHQESVSLEDC